jgi:hypothetical protein
MLDGCGLTFCKNEYCKSGSGRVWSEEEADVLAQELLERSVLFTGEYRYHLCVKDGKCAMRRIRARELSSMGYEDVWSVKALMDSGDSIEGARRLLG